MHDQEGRRLTAAWLNILGGGIVSGGTVSQIASIVSHAVEQDRGEVAIVTVSLCLVVGLSLHGAARLLIGAIDGFER